MYTLVLILFINGHSATSSISGFKSEEHCRVAGKRWSLSGDRTGERTFWCVNTREVLMFEERENRFEKAAKKAAAKTNKELGLR